MWNSASLVVHRRGLNIATIKSTYALTLGPSAILHHLCSMQCALGGSEMCIHFVCENRAHVIAVYDWDMYDEVQVIL